jgi:2-keto-4-pentenoate hydratase/2-oxohepta-3-ene-1,7-dioic acid hydratase in catechol pathway
LKLVTFATQGGTQVGLLDGTSIIPIPGATDMVALLRQSLSSQITSLTPSEGRNILPVDRTRLLAPIPHPPKIIGVGLNYRDHAQETGQPLPKAPILFSKASTAVIGPRQAILIPKASQQVDYEVELGVVIGVGGRSISEEEALSHVAGYTVFNDVSARDFQFRDGQWFRGKSFDTFAPMGPCLVLRDQLSNPQNLRLRLRVNGRTRQDGTTANMVFSVAQLIADISQGIMLEPGDVIATGTPAGVGFVAKPKPVFLQPGDVVEAEIEGIGVLRNPVVAESSSAG